MMLNIFPKLLLALVLFVFVALPDMAFAQRGGVSPSVNICLNTTTGQVFRVPSSQSGCNVAGYDLKVHTEVQKYPSICVTRKTKPDGPWGIIVPPPSPTEAQCKADGGTYYLVSSIPTTQPGTTTTTPTQPGTGINPGNTTTTQPGTTTTPTKPPVQDTRTNNGANPSTVTCDPEFQAEGATCVPKRQPCTGFVCAQSASELVASILRIMLFFAGVIAVVFCIIGGYKIITAQGNDTQLADGKKTLQNALIGLGIVIASYTLVTVLINLLTTAV